jgi:RNA polymerase sigma-70 factor (ECF subfamily)
MGVTTVVHDPVERRSLVRRVLGGDPAAERELYDTHVDRVYRLAYRMTGDTEQASEYTQDTFVRVFERLAEFRGEAALSTWITSIALSVVYNGLRKVKRFRQRETDLEDAAPMPATTRQAEPDLKVKLKAAIEALPEGYRTVFTMHDIEGYTHEEIAATLGVQEGTSKAQLSRARAKLRTMLAEYAGEWR